MSEQWTPEETPPERLREEEAQRYPRHDDPDAAREDVGLDTPRQPKPEGAPPPGDGGSAGERT